MANKKIRRRQLIVHGPLQTKIMLNAAVVPFLILAIHSALVASFSWSLTEEAVEAGVELPSAGNLLIASGGFLVVAAGFMTIFVLMLSHRIAGPMYAISKTLEAVRNGDMSRRCGLRKHDLLGPISADVNTFLDWVEQRGAGASEGTGDREVESDETKSVTNLDEVPAPMDVATEQSTTNA